MKGLLCLFLFLFSFHIVFSQRQNKASKIIGQTILDRYDRIEIDDKETSSLEEIEKLRKRSKEIQFSKGVLRGTLLLQRIALMNNDYVLSGKYSDEAEVLANHLNDYLALSLVNLYRGKIKIILDQYPEAEGTLKKALSFGMRIENEADKHIQLCRIYANFAGMYEGLERPDDWYDYTRKSLTSIETTPRKNLTEYQRSKYFYLYIFELMNMGNFYCFGLKTPRPDLAEPYFKRVMAFQRSDPQYFKILELDIYESMSSFYMTKKEYQIAIGFAQKLLEAEKIKKSPRDRLFAYRNIKDAYRFLNSPMEESKYLRLYADLNDSINSVEKKTIVYQSRDQIKKADVSNRQSILRFLWIGVAFIFLIVLGVWLFLYRKNRLMHHKYEQMIKKLQGDATIGLVIPEEMKDDADYPTVENNDDPEELSNKNIISAETEKRILKQLSSFEKSKKFLKKDLTIGLLASQLDTNTKYLSEVIKKHRSQNFNNYINGLRIDHIVHKLYNEPEYRDYKISYLAEQCGFASYQVFVLAFRKQYGVTPSYFIHNLKSDHVME